MTNGKRQNARQRVHTHLKWTKDLGGCRLEGFIIFQNLLQWDKHCGGLNCTIHLGNFVVLQFLASKG